MSSKVHRSLKKCPKCGARKRVNLKYDPGFPAVTILDPHNKENCGISAIPESLREVCAICGYTLGRQPTINQVKETTGKIKGMDMAAAMKQCCDNCPEHKKGCVGIKNCAHPAKLREAFGFKDAAIEEAG